MGEMAEQTDDDHAAYEAHVEGAWVLNALRMIDGKHHNVKQPKGAKIDCPVCGHRFTKKHPSQSFCNKDGRHRCKDQFHNITNENRRQRAIGRMTRFDY